MDNGNERRKPANEGGSANADEDARPQRGGEAPTTRFGMEDGDNTDIPATGTDPDRQSTAGNAEGTERPGAKSVGASSGLQPSGTVPGGGPGASVGSMGTGGGSTGNSATGNARRGDT